MYMICNYYHNYVPYHPQKRVFNGVHMYQLLFFVKLEKLLLFSYHLTYVLRVLGVIRICTIAQIYKFFCGKENSSVLQTERSLGSITASESLLLFLLKPFAYQFSIRSLLKCARDTTTLSSIRTFADPMLSTDIFASLNRFNEAWDIIVPILISYVDSDALSLDAWSTDSRTLFKLRLTEKFQNAVNVDYLTAVQTETFRFWEINRVSNFSLFH